MTYTSVYIVFLLLYMLTMMSDTDICQSMYHPGAHCIARCRKVKRFVHNRANKEIRLCIRLNHFKHSTHAYCLSSGGGNITRLRLRIWVCTHVWCVRENYSLHCPRIFSTRLPWLPCWEQLVDSVCFYMIPSVTHLCNQGIFGYVPPCYPCMPKSICTAHICILCHHHCVPEYDW
jgi:hypothetical protein